jgi:hypothetical protein
VRFYAYTCAKGNRSAVTSTPRIALGFFAGTREQPDQQAAARHLFLGELVVEGGGERLLGDRVDSQTGSFWIKPTAFPPDVERGPPGTQTTVM